jgi:hypothetical protein
VNLLPFVIAWAVLACGVAALAGYRKLVARGEDDSIHIRDIDAPLVAKQRSISSRLNDVDRWGTSLTVVVSVLGLILATIYVWSKWVEGTQQGLRRVREFAL